MSDQPSLLRVLIITIMRVSAFIITFFIIGGPYYHLLNSLYDAASGQGIARLNTWSLWVYNMFYYGFPALMVFGIILSIAYMFLVLRRRYWSSEEVYY